MFRRGRSALALAACVAAAALLPAQALACEATHRMLELAPGQNVGGQASGFAAPDLGAKEVVLTFDDGPHRTATASILDTLQRFCVPATFFVLGEPAGQNAALLKRQLAAGHSLGGHTFSHTDLTDAPFDQATQDIARGFLPVAAAGGQSSLFRFPQLISNLPLLAWLREHGIAAVGADIDPQDWAGGPPQDTLQRLKIEIREKGRGIILLHDNQPNTAVLLPGLLTFLREEGYSVVGLTGAPAKRQLARSEVR